MSQEPQRQAGERLTPEPNLEAHERVIELFKAYLEGGQEAVERLLKEFRDKPLR